MDGMHEQRCRSTLLWYNTTVYTLSVYQVPVRPEVAVWTLFPNCCFRCIRQLAAAIKVYLVPIHHLI